MQDPVKAVSVKTAFIQIDEVGNLTRFILSARVLRRRVCAAKEHQRIGLNALGVDLRIST